MIILNPYFDINMLQNIDQLRHFLKESWRETYQKQVGNRITTALIKTLSDKNLGGILPDSGGAVIVAMEGERIVASCMHTTRHDTTYIWGLYVLQSVQLSGIGRRMIELIAGEGTNTRTLQVTVLEVSDGAVHFYERLGFRRIDTEEFELVSGHKEQALTMVLRAGSYLYKQAS